MDIDLQTLSTDGFVRISCSDELIKKREEAARRWRSFCALDAKVKERHGTIPFGQFGTGYEKTDAALAATYGSSEGFRLQPVDPVLALRAARGFGDAGVKFVEAALALTSLLTGVRIALLDSLTKQIEGSSGEAPEGFHILRFLHYLGDKPLGKEIGRPHIDRSLATLLLYEDAPGLELLARDGSWHPRAIGQNEIIVIPGLELQRRSRCGTVATCHRVVAKEHAAPDRFSAVCFLEVEGAPRYDLSRLGRSVAPGYNYAMPFEIFATLFTRD